MLLTEWNTEDCIAVRCEEAREEVLELLDQGLSVEEVRQRLAQTKAAGVNNCPGNF